MKDQNRSNQIILCAAAVVFLDSMVDAFVPSTLRINSPSAVSNNINTSDEFILNTPTSLSLAFSIDSISQSLRPFGSWYCQEEDPIGRSIFYE